jgi:chromosome segregation ATPase
MSDGKLKRDGDWKVMHNYIAQLEADRDELLKQRREMSVLRDEQVSQLRAALYDAIWERDQLRDALDELETEIRRGDNDNCNVDTSHCLAVIDNVEPLK